MNWKKIGKIAKWTSLIFTSIVFIFTFLIYIFKEDIKQYAVEEANKYLNKEVVVEKIYLHFWRTFPNVTISFDNVLIYSQFDTIKTLDTTFYAELLQFRFNAMDFFKSNYDVHRIDLNNGQLNLEVREDGLVNYDFFKEKEDSISTPFIFNLENINISNLYFQYNNESTHQFYTLNFNLTKLNGEFSEKKFILNTISKFDILSLKNQSVSLVENKSALCNISVEVDNENNDFFIKKADLSINQLPFYLSGYVRKDSLYFNVKAEELSLEDVANNFTVQELDAVHKINGKGKVNFDLIVEGEMSKTVSPFIRADFEVKDGSLSDNGFNLSQINLNGFYDNGQKNNKEKLELTTVKLFTMNEFFEGRVTITEFSHPRLIGNAKGIVDLNALHRLFGPFSLDKLSGNVFVNGHFDLQIADENRKNMNVKNFQGTMDLNNVLVGLKNQREIQLKSGKLTVNPRKILLDKLELATNRTAVLLHGNIDHLFDYFSKDKNMIVNATVSGKSIYWEDLIFEKEAKKKERDWLLPEKISGNVEVDVELFRMGKHIFRNLKGKVNYKNHLVTATHLRIENAGSKIYGDLKIEEKEPMLLHFSSNLNSNDIDIQSFFKEWNDFDQSVISYKNIKGRSSISARFNFPYDIYLDSIYKEEIVANAKIGIRNGELNRVQVFREITQSLRESSAKLLLTKKDINNFERKLLQLKFDDFENELKIDKGILSIPKMHIKSSALNLNFQGSHSFDNQIDYIFNFRFRELKKDDYSEFGDIIDDQTGFFIFLKMFGNTENPNFTWDRETQKETVKTKTEQAKEDFKSAVKTGFGIQIGDSAVQSIREEKKREEKVIMEFEDEFEKEAPKKEKGFLQKKIDKWKKDKNKEQEESEPQFEFE